MHKSVAIIILLLFSSSFFAQKRTKTTYDISKSKLIEMKQINELDPALSGIITSFTIDIVGTLKGRIGNIQTAHESNEFNKKDLDFFKAVDINSVIHVNLLYKADHKRKDRDFTVLVTK